MKGKDWHLRFQITPKLNTLVCFAKNSMVHYQNKEMEGDYTTVILLNRANSNEANDSAGSRTPANRYTNL
jgi:hypothetical protein